MNAAATKFDGKNKYIRITDIDEQSRYKSDSPVSPDGELSDKYRVCKGDILLARTGASTGKSYLYDANDGTLFFAGFLIRCRIKKDYNPYFVFTQTKTENYNRWVVLMSMRSGQPGINSQEYSSYSFKTPSKLEQDKISKLLSLLDSRIQTQNKIIEGLKSSKANTIKQLFSQSIKFTNTQGNNFPDWEQHTLADISERITLKNKENNQNVLTISAQLGLISQLEFFNKSVSAKDVSGYYLLHEDDFAYNKSYSNGYPMGAIKRLSKYPKGIVSTLYICFRFNKNISKSFMEHYFESGIQNNELEKVAQEGARNHGLLNIGISDFFGINLSIPCIEEQTKITNFLSSLDAKIDLETKLLHQFQEQKKYLLQNLFI